MVHERKVVEITKKDDGTWYVNKRKLPQYKKEAGIWVLYGRRVNDGPIDCLEVAETMDIAKEIETDISLITKSGYDYDKKPKGRLRERFNKEWSEKFPIVEDSRIEDKYKLIARDYKYIYFDIEMLEEKEDTRKACEAVIAISKKAKYWAPLHLDYNIVNYDAVQKWITSEEESLYKNALEKAKNNEFKNAANITQKKSE